MAYAQCASEGGFKCGKCRTTLIIDNDGQMLLLNTENIEASNRKILQAENNTALWHLQTDTLPDWVTDAINQVRLGKKKVTYAVPSPIRGPKYNF